MYADYTYHFCHMKDSIILINVGENIRTHRLALKLSQEQLSFACNLDRSYVGGVERGERNVSIINLCKIALALETTPSSLLNNITQE